MSLLGGDAGDLDRRGSLRIDGQAIYRGHFWSMVMSLMRPGLKIYDTLGAPPGSVSIRFHQLNIDGEDDPRDRREIAEHFRVRGTLR